MIFLHKKKGLVIYSNVLYAVKSSIKTGLPVYFYL